MARCCDAGFGVDRVVAANDTPCAEPGAHMMTLAPSQPTAHRGRASAMGCEVENSEMCEG